MQRTHLSPLELAKLPFSTVARWVAFIDAERPASPSRAELDIERHRANIEELRRTR